MVKTLSFPETVLKLLVGKAPAGLVGKLSITLFDTFKRVYAGDLNSIGAIDLLSRGLISLQCNSVK